MSKTAFATLLLCRLFFGMPVGAQPQTTRKFLHEPTVIQGYPCAKGIAWFFADGHLQKCTVTRDIRFGEVAIPAGSWITLTEDGKPYFVQMPHNAPVLNLMCEGGGWLGTGEASTVSFFPNGKLKTCFLARDQLVQGVPCSHGGLFSAFSNRNYVVLFYESGKLRQCLLAADYGDQHKGELFKQRR
jgi:hypothetical protein